MMKDQIEKQAIQAIEEMAKVIANKTTLSIIEATGVAEILTVDGYCKQMEGEWLKTEAYPKNVYCSLCFKTYVTNEEVIQGRGLEHVVYCTEAEFCPHCGAKMKGGAE